jgi:hypothetical protein
MKTIRPDCFLSEEEIQRGFEGLGLGSEQRRDDVLQALQSLQGTQPTVEVRIVRSNTSTPKELGKGSYA